MFWKKGQITLFILIGVVLLLFTGMIIYFTNLDTNVGVEKQPIGDLDLTPIKNYVEQCVEKTTKEGIIYVLNYGGYYDTFGLQQSNSTIPYYLYNGQEYIPSLQEIGNELGKYVDDKIEKCIDNFNTFKTQGFSFQTVRPKTSIIINSNSVLATLNYPVTIKQQENQGVLSNVFQIIDIDIPSKYDLVKKIIELQKKDTNIFPIGAITQLASQYNFTYQYNQVTDKEIVIMASFNETINEKTLFYNFALGYNKTINEVILKPFPYFRIDTPTLFSYNAQAKGTDVRFYDNTDIFDINQDNGLMKFNSENVNAGRYFINILAIDSFGNEANEIMLIDIIGGNV